MKRRHRLVRLAAQGHRASAGFTLVELLVVIAIIGTLVALLLPAVQSARESARNNTCKNNIKQLATALTLMDTSQGTLPGYVNDLVDPTNRTVGRRASWVVMIFPYMEQSATWDEWSQNFSRPPGTPSIEFITCPSDPPELLGEPSLNYVANAGMAFTDATRTGGGPSAPAGFVEPGNREFVANGVFFDNARNLQILTGGAADGREQYPAVACSINYVQANDGTSNTLMLSESVHTWFYAYDGDGSTPSYEPGASATEDISPIVDAKHIFGFVWSNDADGVERINGDNNYDTVRLPQSMADFSQLGNPGSGTSEYESLGYPSSNHPSGVNVVFVDSHIVFMNESIAPHVYAQLMTSNRKRSKFFSAAGGAGPMLDKDMPQPSDDEF